MLNMNIESTVVLFPPQSVCSVRPSSCSASSLTVSGTRPCTAPPTCLRGPTSSAYRGPCPLCAPPCSTSWTAASCAPKPTTGICVGTSTERIYGAEDAGDTCIPHKLHRHRDHGMGMETKQMCALWNKT